MVVRENVGRFSEVTLQYVEMITDNNTAKTLAQRVHTRSYKWWTLTYVRGVKITQRILTSCLSFPFTWPTGYWSWHGSLWGGVTGSALNGGHATVDTSDSLGC